MSRSHFLLHVSFFMLDTLPDEILDIIFLFCMHHGAFVAPVCKRVWRTEERNRPGPTRRCAVYIALQTMDTLNYALSQKMFASLVRTEKLEWTTLAKNAAFRRGDKGVLASICPELTMDPGSAMKQIARWNRMDVFLDPVYSCLVDWVDVMVARLVGRSCMPPKPPDPATRLVACVIVPALCGGSVDILDYVVSNIRRRLLSRDCVWNLLISGGRSSARVELMAVSAATAKDAATSLEYLCELMADAARKYTMETVRRHVAAVGLIMSKSDMSASALAWCRKRAPSLSMLIQGFNEDVHGGMSIVPIRQARLVVDPAFFRPRRVTSYNVMQRETKSGGWMHEAFHGMHGHETSCLPWEMVSFTNSTTFGDIDTTEKRDIAVASMEDCFESAMERSVPTRDALCRHMDALSEKSVYASYTVARRVLLPQRRCMYSTGRPIHDVLHHVFYGKGCMLYAMLLKAVYNGLVNVVVDLLSKGFDSGRHLSRVQHDNVLMVVIYKDSVLMADAILASGQFSPTRCMVVRAASQRRANFLDKALQFNTELVHSDIGQSAYTTQDPFTIHIAMGHRCFATGSALHARAVFLLAESRKNKDIPHCKKRRRLCADMLSGPLLRACLSSP